MHLTQDILSQEYAQARNKAIFCLKNKQIDEGLAYARYSAKIAWKYPINKNFVDDEIESEIIKQVGLLFDPLIIKNKPNRVVLYCSWLQDNAALIEQYLYYFLDKNYHTLLIVPDSKQISSTFTIKNRIAKSDNLIVHEVRSKKPLKIIQEIRHAVLQFAPTKTFLHLYPDDAIGFASFTNIKGSNTYFISHSDHTFWLGKHIADYFIEFRRFGVALATLRRNISPEKILVNPFYPISNGVSFKGFPFERKGKTVVVSGANLYKYYLDKDLYFFRIIAKMLKEHKDMIFCLCGKGNPDIIIQLFVEEGVNNQFYFLGHRNDFYSLIGQSDIYLESYPLKGGLSVLMAIEQKTPAVGITANHNASGSVQDFLNIKNYIEPRSLDEFYEKVKALVVAPRERKNLAEALFKNDFKKEGFYSRMNSLMQDDLSSTKKTHANITISIDDELNLTEYLSQPTANIYSLMQMKMVILKSYMGLIEKLQIIFATAKNSKRFNSLSLVKLIIRSFINI